MTAFKNCRVCDELVYIPSNGKHSHKCPGMNLQQAVQRIAQLEAENVELRSAMREIYEVWAGSDGFIPATAPEAYLSKLISEIVYIARTHLAPPLENS